MDSQEEENVPVEDSTITTTEEPSVESSENDSLTICSTESGTETAIIEISETSTLSMKSLPSTSSQHTTTTASTTESRRARRARSSHNLARYQRHILSLTNSIRAQHDAPPLILDARLNEAARQHNADIALVIKDLSHISSDGSTLTERLLKQEYDFRYASENLARGQRDCRWVMKSWMKSPGHRRNILNERVREMGLHVGVGEGKMYWTQVFGIRRGER